MVDPVDLNSTDASQARVRNPLAYGWLEHKQLERPLKIVADGFKSGCTVLSPPDVCAFDLVSRADCDANPQAHC